MRILFFGLAAVAAVAVGPLVAAEKVAPDKLPKPVRDAMTAKFPDAKVKTATKEADGGESFYEIAFTFKDHRYAVEITPAGAFRVIDRELDAKELPTAVAAAVDRAYPKARITLIEEVTRKDKIEYYEVTLVTADRKEVEATVDPRGKILKEVNKDK
jgi:uncharacterized membrane protein YkoI